MGQDKVRGRIDAVNIPPWGATAFDVDGLSDPVATARSVRTSLNEKTATFERWGWLFCVYGALPPWWLWCLS